MKTWFFTEDAYPYLPDPESYESIRVSLPNRHYDPEKGADLYHKYLDMWCAAEEMGLEIMLNEHHQTATCVVPAAPLMLSILARETSRARLLILGNPIANRNTPVRVAEEMAMVDVLSRGRLECGFVRGVPYEAAPANVIPLRGAERLWEAHDLILKCWTAHDGPFNFEGRHYHMRQVNVWPRPYQQPHPPVWTTGGSDVEHGFKTVSRGFTFAMFLTPVDALARMFAAVRRRCQEEGHVEPADDQFAFMPLVAVGETEEEARRVIDGVFWYVTHNKSEPQFRAPPGYVERRLYADFLTGKFSGGRTDAVRREGMEYFRRNHIALYGTPDQVVEQIRALYRKIGGFGHLIAMLHSGDMDYATTAKSMKLFAEEVMPQVAELGTRSAGFGPLARRGEKVTERVRSRAA